jgi:ribosome-associated protein
LPAKHENRHHTQHAEAAPARDGVPHEVGEGAGLAEAKLALEAALDKKALEPTLIDVRGLCSYTNYVLIVSGRSDRQVDAIAEGINLSLKDQGHRNLSVEGRRSGAWVLIDFGDFVVHVFHHPAREHYNLESLWSDAPRIPVDVPPEARIAAEDRY